MKNFTKLAIITVYLVPKEDEKLLDIHLKYIERNTEVPYTIYAVANRLPLKLHDKLEKHPKIKICNLQETKSRSSNEHAYYLDELVKIAVEDGASHICTLDVDSFPIRRGWCKDLSGKLSLEKPLACVIRKENGDTILAHPSFTLFHRDFYIKYKPKFFPSTREYLSLKYKFFAMKFYKELDTGIGYSYILYLNKLSCYGLLRSSKAEDHYIMGGIYGDTIFHLGGNNRRMLFFRGDSEDGKASFLVKTLIKLLYTLRYIAYISPSEKIGQKLRKWAFLKRGKLLQKQIRKINKPAFEYIKKKLLENSESYLNYLTGGHFKENIYECHTENSIST